MMRFFTMGDNFFTYRILKEFGIKRGVGRGTRLAI